jgi:hypothetical protein
MFSGSATLGQLALNRSGWMLFTPEPQIIAGILTVFIRGACEEPARRRGSMSA